MTQEKIGNNNGGNKSLEEIVSLAKRRGFVFQGSEIYGGLAGLWDYGPLGLALKSNIINLWWKTFVLSREDIYGIDAAILMNSAVWEASGHVAGFSDPLIECQKCKKRYRADHLMEGDIAWGSAGEGYCPNCNEFIEGYKEPRQFNMMFKTQVGAINDSSAVAYLRPETAQGIFVNFKNVVDAFHPKLPFGIAQIGKAFRNEITPRDFLFRAREFEQMEIEYFIREEEWERHFEAWLAGQWNWIDLLGIPRVAVRLFEHPPEGRSHYSKRTVDIEFRYPFGMKELSGLAYRTDYDLQQHMQASKVDLRYIDQVSGEKYMPHVIEPSFGVERALFAVLTSAYDQDEVGGSVRTVLRLKKELAPVRIAVFPLLKNKEPLVSRAREVFAWLRKEGFTCMFDDNGNIGKRYRRQDEIGTPHCVTIDFETLDNDTVTVRDRDSGEQVRISTPDLLAFLRA